ncbi:hypothetical protein SmJEL517_g01582 [Synchytrium microbalum]|uniref:Fatty acid hydroxylase domain-containing protein n=1 Tax=Synchytrium microbalum TaxID=1806994 RepID=A0A507CAN3_9FUNG|nr:uncharacterized protein SmJEL517_g01582 [Synchytrium microbalum]TPX36239.1 hypothetical protein SmJEL517_g01582 [Synchytrium microbalum]
MSLSKAWSSAVTACSNHIGDTATYVLFATIALKASATYNAVLFHEAAKRGWWKEYRIQQKYVDTEITNKAVDEKVGMNSIPSLIMLVAPFSVLQYKILQYAYGFNIHKMPTSALKFWKDFLLLTVAWDAALFFIHFGLHKIPYLYKTIHKKHHEFKVVEVSVGGHLTLIDHFLMDRLPPLIGMLVAKPDFAPMIAFLAFYYHIASRAHCGYELPWDPLNWFMPYVRNHDYHHENTHSNYQTLFFYLDYIVDGFGKGNRNFWKVTADRREAARQGKLVVEKPKFVGTEEDVPEEL